MSDAPLTSIRGRVWTFGDDVDTDAMAPWTTLDLPWEERRKACLSQRPEFAASVRPGDLIVAGRNWGCGSSREQAPENLQRLGVAAVLGESFSRIYFRSAIAMAFPTLVASGVRAAFMDGDVAHVDLASGLIRNVTSGAELAAAPYPPEMLAIVRAGGLMALLRARLAAEGSRA